MDTLLKSLKQIHGVARSSEAGEVVEFAGSFDADTLSAVAAVSAAPLREIGDMLAAGRLERWYLVTEQATYYGSERGAERLLAAGEPLKNPEALSKQLQSSK
ncbi:MAG: hypothetical protein K0R38_1230 [Polyangiaceae bacterium]|jgi:hypothetical protein|nr:hypothetical protein [Polyangiaceae bacterium]